MTLDWATARLAEFRAFEASMEETEERAETRRGRRRRETEERAETEETEERAERAETEETVKETGGRAPSASVVIDATVDEAVEWAIPSEDARRRSREREGGDGCRHIPFSPDLENRIRPFERATAG